MSEFKLQSFSFHVHELDAVLFNGEPIISAVHACEILGLNDRMSVHLEKLSSRQKIKITQEMVNGCKDQPGSISIPFSGKWFITESGLYKLVMRSEKPEAEEFQNWICDEVIPSVRKTGGYGKTEKPKTDEEIIADAVVIAHKVLAARDARLALLQQKNDIYEGKIEVEVTESNIKAACSSVKELYRCGYNEAHRIIYEHFKSQYGVDLKKEWNEAKKIRWNSALTLVSFLMRSTETAKKYLTAIEQIKSARTTTTEIQK